MPRPHRSLQRVTTVFLLLAACASRVEEGSDGGSGDGISGGGSSGTAGPSLTTASTDGSTSSVSSGDGSAGGAEAGTTDGGSDSASDSTSGSSTTATPTTSSSSGGEPGSCTVASECDNGVFCDGVEDCVAGECVPGEAVACTDDAIDCTTAVCDPELDQCVQRTSDELCGCGETCDAELGCGNHCTVATCNGQTYQCGDCVDNDGDCKVDSDDTDCWGACDNNESGWNGNVPGQQNQSTCNAMDCYFDSDSGAGNDDCYWSHSCDPLEPSSCTYDAAHVTPGSGSSCDSLSTAQSDTCTAYCGPLSPNGCDCFGCCDVQLPDMSTVTIYLGTLDADGNGTCNLEAAADPALCNPCTQVPGCLNTCGHCELCLGKTELPADCEVQSCSGGATACGLEGQEDCPSGQVCVTGCCQPVPQ